MNYYLAIDIGASSGRHIIGFMENGQIKTDEVYRFSNGIKKEKDHLIWDIDALNKNIKEGIFCALKKYPKIESLSIDTWGVDYVLLDGDKEILPVISYRDLRTEKSIPKVHEIIPFERLYELTGIEFQSFTSIYQFYDDLLTGRLSKATDYLMMPDYLMYKLCHKKAHEYTEATTTGLVDAVTGTFSEEIIDKLKFPKHLFTSISKPGEILGTYLGMNVVLTGTHDTASAIYGIPMEGNELYISSGTWSILGVKTEKPICNEESRIANFSNEGGIFCNHYQKNIMGMWLINRLKEELCPDESFTEIVKQAKESTCKYLIDANSPSFFSPESMKKAFDEALNHAPMNKYDYFKVAYRSLSYCYHKCIKDIEKNTGRTYEKIYIVGGGAKNTYLNELTESFTGKKVIALPIEATAIGNIKLQMKVANEI